MPGLVRARTPAATSPASQARATPGRRAAGVLDGQKTWTTRGAFCTHLFGLFRTDPDVRAAPGPHATCSSRSTRRASPCGASAGSTATRASPRCSSTTPSWPTTPSPAACVLGRGRPGLVGRDGHHRLGAGPHPALAGPLPRDRRRGSSTSTASRARRPAPARAGRRGVDAGRGVPPVHPRHGHPVVGRCGQGAESARSTRSGGPSSTCDLHEIALDLLGPEAEVEGPWSKGWQFALSGPIYAGTNEIQRNIAAERVLGLPRK